MSYKSSCVPRSYRNAQDFFIGAAVLGQFGHSIALEMAGWFSHQLNLILMSECLSKPTAEGELPQASSLHATFQSASC